MTDRKPSPDRSFPKTLRGDARALIESCPGWNARLAARRITRQIDGMLADGGVSLAQIGLMALIATSEDDRLGALSRRAGLDQSTLTRNLQALARDGLVEIVTAEKDQRRRAVWLTETGARRLEAALPLWRQAQEQLAEVQYLAIAVANATRSLDPE